MILRAYTKEDLDYYLNDNGLVVSERDILREKAFSLTLVNDDGVAIGSAGLDRIYDHCALAWARINIEMLNDIRNLKRIIREIRKGIKFYIKENPQVVRIYAEVSNNQKYIRFAKLCGFYIEAVLGNLHYDGGDLVIMRYEDGNSCNR